MNRPLKNYKRPLQKEALPPNGLTIAKIVKICAMSVYAYSLLFWFVWVDVEILDKNFLDK